MKKISLNILECVVSETHCVITFIQFCESLVVYKMSLFCSSLYEGCYERHGVL